ncbi:hypothetical protein SEUCBS139899_000870 [Sporothrix eucalyptigena]|uniref:DUF7735 domain-containing protein n=1 Tax=Sporothrix eucalyptigena TaxID=1812306 RepID=A0ABP0BZ55_9PEZI
MAHTLWTAAAAVLALGATTSAATSLITAAPAATDIAGALSTLLPTAPPTSTEDTGVASISSLCQSDLFVGVFLHATPEGDFATALSSFGSVITSQASQACGTTSPCPSPAPSLWCAFPDVAPSSVLANYTSYGLAAASYFPSGLSPLVSLATACPEAWYAANTMVPQGPDDFREFAILGECFATVRRGVSSTGSAAATATETATAKQTTATTTGKETTGTASTPSSVTSEGKRAGDMSVALCVVTVACSVMSMLL